MENLLEPNWTNYRHQIKSEEIKIMSIRWTNDVKQLGAVVEFCRCSLHRPDNSKQIRLISGALVAAVRVYIIRYSESGTRNTAKKKVNEETTPLKIGILISSILYGETVHNKLERKMMNSSRIVYKQNAGDENFNAFGFEPLFVTLLFRNERDLIYII
ncbi:hypothetical protein GWI33_008408 [Rhynchophorus ferrugineus]|uniref:Uncharacterized protein n=1 Tax=Rhynchophorus ferrugineus TaxID=354439 RepID=A0A834ME69_RHYFE|nr:hypothetical protein GWI33_008408 [Rhynchophorus ferrugineus]